MTASYCAEDKGFHWISEIQRHLEESRAERESRLNMASRLDLDRAICERENSGVRE